MYICTSTGVFEYLLWLIFFIISLDFKRSEKKIKQMNDNGYSPDHDDDEVDTDCDHCKNLLLLWGVEAQAYMIYASKKYGLACGEMQGRRK